VCAKTGEPADGTVNVTFSVLPSWTYLLLLAGIFPFLIAWVFANERIPAQLPVRRSVVDRYHDLRWRALASFGIAVASGVVAVISVEWVWWGAAALAFMVGFVTLVQRAAGWLDVHPLRGTTLVELRRVSTQFAEAVTHERTTS
jgi:hypothetical protein